MSITIRRIRMENKIRSFLKIYTVFAFMFILAIPIFLFFGSRFVVESQQDYSCTGAFNSGQECNRLGHPAPYKTWSCLPDSSSDTNYSCQQTDVNGCTYNDGQPCGCEQVIPICEARCREHYASSPNGTYQYPPVGGSDPDMRCANCQQNLSCNCQINNVDQCPYQAGQVQFLFNYPGETNPRPANQIDLICGQTVQVGMWDTHAGRLVNGGNITYNNSATNQNTYTLTTQNNNSTQTFNFSGLIANNSSGYYAESQCRPSATLTCRPPDVDSCPYNRVDLHFSKDGVNFGTQPPQLECGERIYTRVINTQNGSIIGRNNANLYMTQCSGGNCGAEQLLPTNNHGFVTSNQGPTTYRFRTAALRANGQPYPEAACNAFEEVSCTPKSVPDSCNQTCDGTCGDGLICNTAEGRCRDPRWPNEPSCRVDYPPEKTVENIDAGTNSARVVFRIDLRNNTTNTTFTNVPFRDTYNPSQLIFRNPVTGIRIDRNGTEVVRNTFSLTGRGTLSHGNLATILGPLGPGERYVLYMNFDATATGYNVCNNMEWNPNEYGWRGDDACLDVRITPPDTDL